MAPQQRKIPKTVKKPRGRPRKSVSAGPKVIEKGKAPVVTAAQAPEKAEISTTEKGKAQKPYFYAVGRRKTAMAKVRLFEGDNGAVVNSRDSRQYFLTRELQKIAFSPLGFLGLENKFGIQIYASGGGIHAQAEAVRHGIARALVARNPADKPTLKKAGFLTRDPRVKERKKPGLKRARRAPQWSKR